MREVPQVLLRDRDYGSSVHTEDLANLMDAAAGLGGRAGPADAVGAALRAAAGPSGRLGVAFSGGVDSSVLLALAVRALGSARVVAVLGVSPSLAADERLTAHRVAAFVGVPVVEVETREDERAAYRANGPDRCYHCKDELFTRSRSRVAARHGLVAVAYGENADDVRRPDRPGALAAGEHGVLRPLADAGLDKAGVRRDRPGAAAAVRGQARGAVPGVADPAPRGRGPGEAAPGRDGGGRLCTAWDSPTAGCATTATSPGSSSIPRTSCERRPTRCARSWSTPSAAPGSGSSRWTSWGSSRGRSRCHSWRRGMAELDMAGVDEVADLDHERARRRGYPEAVYCEGKPPDHVRVIAATLRDRAATTDGPPPVALFTRATAEHARAVLDVLPEARWEPEARLIAWPADPPPATGGRVAVVAAGTSDLPVAREAALTAGYLGRATDLVVDVGVAGLHRISRHLDTLRAARAIVVVAGMDGALPGVVAGLVGAPVVAVPTSVGYGAAFGGIAALLTMLNACAPGIGVVNIDNGYGAGHLAAQIAAP